MAIHPCEKCRFPMVQQMSSRPDSTEQVYYCQNCGREETVDKVFNNWIRSIKRDHTKAIYTSHWKIWIQYCSETGLPTTGDQQLEQIKQDRLSLDQTVKFRFDNEIPLFFKWLTTKYRGRDGKPLSESSALTVCSAPRSFFKHYRYKLEVQELPSTVSGTIQDHAYDVYQLRALFQQGDLYERTVLSTGKDLWLRVGDFAKLPRDLIETAIKREEETAEAEKREPDIIEFELISEKEKVPCSCHLSRETVALLKEYLKTTEPSGYLFGKNGKPILEDTLNDILKRLSEKAKITLTGRVRWHCLRKFGITFMHGKVTEPVLKYMTGKAISKDLRVYIQANRETYKAFKMIEPQISISQVNAAGVKMSSELEALRKEVERLTVLNLGLQKLLMKYIPEEDLRNLIKMEVTPVEAEGVTEPSMEAFTKAVENIGKKEKDRQLQELLANNNNQQ